LPRALINRRSGEIPRRRYELPNNKAEPHEITVDLDGNAWVTQRVGGKLGRLDGKNLTYSEIAPPAGPSPTNRLNAITRAPDGKLWFIDGGPNRRWLSLDPKNNEFALYELPKLKSGSASGNTMRVHPNGTVWLKLDRGPIRSSAWTRQPRSSPFMMFRPESNADEPPVPMEWRFPAITKSGSSKTRSVRWEGLIQRPEKSMNFPSS
jgi:hypothetical protein